MKNVMIDRPADRVAGNTLKATVALISEVRMLVNRALDQAENRLYEELAVREQQKPRRERVSE